MVKFILCVIQKVPSTWHAIFVDDHLDAVQRNFREVEVVEINIFLEWTLNGRLVNDLDFGYF
jgi:hypothetical protein